MPDPSNLQQINEDQFICILFALQTLPYLIMLNDIFNKIYKWEVQFCEKHPLKSSYREHFKLNRCLFNDR